MIVYDVNSNKSFENLDHWKDEFLVQVRVDQFGPLEDPWSVRLVNMALAPCGVRHMGLFVDAEISGHRRRRRGIRTTSRSWWLGTKLTKTTGRAEW